jgi:hypothetical protein
MNLDESISKNVRKLEFFYQRIVDVNTLLINALY